MIVTAKLEQSGSQSQAWAVTV
jgi:pyruvoyl-dependent arginine decarboxylase (PvlArgDC)